MPVAVVTPVVSAVPFMSMLSLPVGGPTMVVDAFVVAIAVGVVGMQFSRVSVCSHGNRVRSGVGKGKQQIIVPH